MGEFQCYQFRSFDRPLTETERKEVDSLSSRGQVTAHSATFIYHYSDFRHQPEKVVEQYFDAMIYFANWGTKRLLFRLPTAQIDVAAIRQFCLEDEYAEDYISLQEKEKFHLLDINYSNEGGGGWMEEDDFDLGDIGQIRDDLIQGDYRALYLVWAQFSQPYGDDDFKEDHESTPPPIPANLNSLTVALNAFIDFFELDGDLLSAIQSLSPKQEADLINYEKLLNQLPEAERVAWLRRLLNDNEPRLNQSLKKRLKELAPLSSLSENPTYKPAQLQTKSMEAEEKRKAKAKKAAQAAHIKKMKEFEKEEAQMWETVSFNLLRGSGKPYDLATAVLKDLRDLAKYQGKEMEFQEKVTILRKQYASRTSLMRRWNEAGLN